MNITLKELFILSRIDVKKIKILSKLILLLYSLFVFLSCGSDKDVLDDIVDVIPTTPTNFTFSNVTLNSVLLSWGASIDENDSVEYNVYQNSALITKVEGTSYLVEGLLPNTEYTFAVSAIDTAGNESSQSQTVMVLTLEENTSDTDSPTTPTDLSITNLGQSTADLSWEASSDNIGVTGYIVYLNGTNIAVVTSTSYSISGLTASTEYTLAVSATDAAGNTSAQSNVLSFTTTNSADTEAPTVPANLSASNIGQTGVDISWSASTDNVAVTTYKIFLDGTEIGTTAATNFAVTGLTASTTYTVTISASDAAENESSQSEDLEITTESASVGAKVLVFTKTSGFDHNTRQESETMVQAIADQLGFDITVDNTGSEFDSTSNLNNYDVIFFTNTSGDMLNASQRSNVESYAAQGGNFISNHAASDAYGHSTASSVSGNGKGVWDWYAENVTGCSVRNSPNHTSSGFGATVGIQNGNTELTNGISFPWSDNEEWYYWEDGYIDSSFTELLRVSDTGSNSYDDARMTAHYWNRADGGKSFYTSMGHAKGKYSDTEFVQLMTNAFAYMLP